MSATEEFLKDLGIYVVCISCGAPNNPTIDIVFQQYPWEHLIQMRRLRGKKAKSQRRKMKKNKERRMRKMKRGKLKSWSEGFLRLHNMALKLLVP